MIPSLPQIAYAVFGAWRLAHLDKGGLAYFDDSNAGFLRSFFCAVLVLPAYAAITLIGYAGVTIEAGLLEALLIEGLSYVVAWLLWPVIAYTLCQMMDRERFYFRYIVAYNWSFFIVMAVALPVSLLGYAGALPGDFGGGANWIVYLLSLVYAGVIAKLALEITAGAAFGLVVADTVASYILHSWAYNLIAAPGAAG